MRSRRAAVDAAAAAAISAAAAVSAAAELSGRRPEARVQTASAGRRIRNLPRGGAPPRPARHRCGACRAAAARRRESSPAAGADGSSIRPRTSPVSTRSPAASSISRSRSARPCSSARCSSPRAPATRARPTETANTDAFVEVDEVTLQGEVKRIFTGWMFASSPGLHAVEHPIYDLWLTDCRGGSQIVAAEGAAPPPEPPPPPHSRSRRRSRSRSRRRLSPSGRRSSNCRRQRSRHRLRRSRKTIFPFFR